MSFGSLKRKLKNKLPNKKRIKAVLPVVGIVVVTAIVAFLLTAFLNGEFKDVLFGWDVGGATTMPSEGIILFYGDGCEQCAKVDAYISNNNVAGKIPFAKLEVFHSATNTAILSDKAQSCGLPAQQLGVPFLWEKSSGRCVVGYADVIDFLRKKMADLAKTKP